MESTTTINWSRLDEMSWMSVQLQKGESYAIKFESLIKVCKICTHYPPGN